MIQKLILRGFKNFEDVSLTLGPFSVLIGTNASGKSNLRDAFRFLHGISRGYNLAEIIGEKWAEGGVLQWKGIRGGTTEAALFGHKEFTLKAHVGQWIYGITVRTGENGTAPLVVRESLYNPMRGLSGLSDMLFDSHCNDDPVDQPPDRKLLHVRLPRGGAHRSHGPRLILPAAQPAISQIARKRDAKAFVKEACAKVLDALSGMRFLDLSPDAMRQPCLPGQLVLGDRGENLSAVLQEICQDESAEAAMLGWLQELTPLDVVDFEFVPDQTGRILVTLVESSGARTSAYSASDGTLRFLAMIAALLGPKPDTFYFFEELENGIHPTRLHLLLQLIEQTTSVDNRMQVVASSHSPQLLAFINRQSLEHVSLVSRLEGRRGAGVTRILDIPEAKEVLEKQDLATLHASGWLEDAVTFSSEEEG